MTRLVVSEKEVNHKETEINRSAFKAIVDTQNVKIPLTSTQKNIVGDLVWGNSHLTNLFQHIKGVFQITSSTCVVS